MLLGRRCRPAQVYRFKPLDFAHFQIGADTLEQRGAQRRRLVDDQTRITNRLTRTLKNYFPQPLAWFADKDTELFCDFLERWPTLRACQQARRATLERFFCEHHVRYPKVIDQRIQAIKSATALTADEGVIVPNALYVQALVTQLRVTLSAIDGFNQAIEQRAQAHPNFAIFQSCPAAGPVFASRLLTAFGEQRERYATPDDLQQYAGIAPVTERSGRACWVHWRWQCPTFLRQTFVEWAALTIPRSFWARAYYDQQRQKGNSHQAAVRSLAFKWILILFRCWQNRTPYDESAYLTSLKKRGSPLIQHLASSS